MNQRDETIGRAGEPLENHRGQTPPQTRRQEPTLKNVDVRSLRRMLTWTLELMNRQRKLVLSALEVVDGPQQEQPPPKS